VPDQHVAFVDVRGGELRALRRPPVAAETVHLLGRHELGQTPGRVGGFGRSQLAHAALDVADVQGTVDHERDAPSRGVQPRVVDRAGRAQLARRTLDEVRQEHPPADREHRAPDGVVGRVRRDARRALAGAFAPGAFGVGEVAFGFLRARVEHQPLLRPRHVERPQATDRVVARLRAQVDDAFAVGRDREGTRHAQ
jgi:hypothetical protein